MYCVVFIRCTTAITRCHSLPFVVTLCHSLPLVVPLIVISCHSLSLVVPLVVTVFQSFWLVVPLVITRCHLLSLVVTRCTTRLSFYKRSSDSLKWTSVLALISLGIFRCFQCNYFWKQHQCSCFFNFLACCRQREKCLYSELFWYAFFRQKKH